MISPALPRLFSSPAPFKKLKEISPFPFILDLVPLNPSFIYDFDRLVEEGIDLETNMIWYRVPSLQAVVFFRWVEAPEGYGPDEASLSDEEVDQGFVFEVDDGSGNQVQIDEESIHYKKYFTMLPCNYDEYVYFYHKLVSTEGRRLLQNEFMQTLDAGAEGSFGDRDGSEESLITTSPQGLSDWESESSRAVSDEEDDVPPVLIKTPTRRVARILELGEYDPQSWEGVWIKVRVGGRLRNPSSLGDLTPTRRTCSLEDD